MYALHFTTMVQLASFEVSKINSDFIISAVTKSPDVFQYSMPIVDELQTE